MITFSLACWTVPQSFSFWFKKPFFHITWFLCLFFLHCHFPNQEWLTLSQCWQLLWGWGCAWQGAQHLPLCNPTSTMASLTSSLPVHSVHLPMLSLRFSPLGWCCDANSSHDCSNYRRPWLWFWLTSSGTVELCNYRAQSKPNAHACTQHLGQADIVFVDLQTPNIWRMN